ncbi:MAG: hypothetical protein M1549_02430 [Candidatus Dependentiae bacterium]|nr:hypothetical protein [Candidatus Dependentiae bacterium]
MIKKIASGLLAISCIGSPLASNATQGTTAPAQHAKGDFYQQLLPYFLDGAHAPEKASTTTIGTAVDGTAAKPKVADVTLRSLTPNESAQMTLELLGHLLPMQAVDPAAIAPLEKFRLVAPGARDMVGVLMPRGTLWGKMAFARDCTRPFSHVQLVERQEITRFFAENAQARKKAQRAFDLIRSGQRAYLAYFEQLDDAAKQLLDGVYFSNGLLKPLNTSKAAMAAAEAGNWLGLFMLPAVFSGLAKRITATGGSAFLTSLSSMWEREKSLPEKIGDSLATLARVPDKAVTNWGQEFFYNHWPISSVQETDAERQEKARKLSEELAQKKSGLELFQEHPFTFYLPKDILAKEGARLDVHLREKKQIAYDIAKIEVEKQNPQSLQDRYKSWRDDVLERKGRLPQLRAALGTYGWTLFWDALLAWSLKKAATEVAQKNSIYNNYQMRLIGMRKIVRGLTMLADIAASVNSAALNRACADIELFLEAGANSELSTLLDELETKTFAGEQPSFFSNRPRILTTNKRMEACKELFVRPLAAAGQIEPLVAAAEYHAAHQPSDANSGCKPVCFVEFVDDTEPRLELENCWNILVPEDKAVSIDQIYLGKNGVQNAAFTGPNGTGKSTNENAIAGAHFMSKFGIACASHATLTPFELFEVHRNEVEDIGKGMSTFMAQKARFDEICSRIAQLRDQRMVIFMDEPLSGTVEEEAGRIIYEKCRDLLAPQKQAICIIATHAAQPTHLEADTHGAFKNFYVEVFEREPGVFERTYKLRPGLLTQWFEDAEWRHRFVEWLSHEGTQIISQ